MTTAPDRPLVRAYDGENPYELVDSKWGHIERWRANAMATGEASAATQARHDAVETIDDIEEQRRELAAGQGALAIERATFDAEKRAFADQAAALAGRLSVEWDRMAKLRADQLEEPLATPPGEPGERSDQSDPSDPNKPSEPNLALEDDTHIPSGELHAIAAKEDPDEQGGEPPASLDQEVEFPMGELPRPPVVAEPVSAGLDNEE